MTRVVTLNLNHRTHPRTVPTGLVTALGELGAEIAVLTEFVAGKNTEQLLSELSEIGLTSWAMSQKLEYTQGRFQNQVLIASSANIEIFASPEGGPDGHARTNFLAVRTHDISLAGLRAPTYKGALWQEYWDWAESLMSGDLVIGDFNVDPERGTKRDRVIEGLIQRGGWKLAEADGDWSYRGHTGNQSKLDHAIFRGSLTVDTAKYIAAPFTPDFTDHAALVVDVNDYL